MSPPSTTQESTTLLSSSAQVPEVRIEDGTTFSQDALESGEVRPQTQTESDDATSPNLRSASPAHLQVPTPREWLSKLFEAQAPPPLALPQHLSLLCPTGSPYEDSDPMHASPNACLSTIPLPPSPRSEFEPDLDAETPVITLRPPSPGPCEMEPEPEQDQLQLQPQDPEGPEQRLRKQITRRYLSAAYIRGETLPFSIQEENEADTSESQYSTESAVNLNDSDPPPADSDESVTSHSTSQPSHLDGNVRELYNSDVKGQCFAMASTQVPKPVEAKSDEPATREDPAFPSGEPTGKRSLLKQISLRKRMKSMIDTCRQLSRRGKSRISKLKS